MDRPYRRAFIEITNSCNLACTFCAPARRPKAAMPLALFESAAAQAGELASVVSLHLLGEPLTHPDFPAVLKACSRLGLDVNLVTNGLLLGSYPEALFSEPCLRQISISLHALAALPAAGRKKALAALVDFAKKKQERMVVGFRLRCAKPDAFFSSALQSVLDAFGAGGAPASGFVKLADRVFLNFGGMFAWPGTGPGSVKTGCLALRHHFGILSDGRVVPCCADYDGALALGNIKNAALQDILCGPAAEALRAGFRGRAPMTAYCEACGFAAPEAQG